MLEYFLIPKLSLSCDFIFVTFFVYFHIFVNMTEEMELKEELIEYYN